MADHVARGGTLILSGRFAGSYVGRYLRKLGTTIVSRENCMLYTPMLPEAAGTLEPRHVVVPIRMMCPQAELILAEAQTHETERRRVRVQAGNRGFWVHYENLVVALGFKTLADAIRLRNHVLGRLEAPDAAPNPTHLRRWWERRTYHLYQLPLLSRKRHVVADWTVTLFFRRDIVELDTLGHRERVGDV